MNTFYKIMLILYVHSFVAVDTRNGKRRKSIKWYQVLPKINNKINKIGLVFLCCSMILGF